MAQNRKELINQAEEYNRIYEMKKLLEVYNNQIKNKAPVNKVVNRIQDLVWVILKEKDKKMSKIRTHFFNSQWYYWTDAEALLFYHKEDNKD